MRVGPKSLERLDRERHFHPFSSVAEHLEVGPRIFTEGKGVWLRWRPAA